MDHKVTHRFDASNCRLSLRAFEIEARTATGSVELRSVGKEILRSSILDYVSAERWNDDGRDHLEDVIKYATEAIRKIDEAAEAAKK